MSHRRKKEQKDIAIRCYAPPVKAKISAPPRNDEYVPGMERYLCLDTETLTNEGQAFTFGSASLVVRGKVSTRFLFYDPDVVKPKDLKVIEETGMMKDCVVLTVSKFREKVLLPEIYDNKAPLVGFNLAFDLSRLAIKISPARGRNKGGFSCCLSPNYPNLIVRHIGPHHNVIRFVKGLDGRHEHGHINGSRSFPGTFIDLSATTFALTERAHSLKSACQRFGAVNGKLETDEHGKITTKYIEYNLRDVEATIELFQRVMKEYEKYELDAPIWELVSPASLAKALLRKIGVRSFLQQNPDFPPELISQCMQAFFGGRSEVRIRHRTCQVSYLDFLSMYPTMCCLLKLWRYIICDRIERTDVTEETIRFVDDLALEDLKDKGYWRRLNVLCTVLPDDDPFIVRSDFDGTTYNIGTVFLTSEHPLQYPLADVVAAKLRTGRSPKILKAVRFDPVGVQEGLMPTRILGGEVIDPYKDDPFVALSVQRNEYKLLKAKALEEGSQRDESLYDSLQRSIKLVLNSMSYGIYVQMNTNDSEREVTVYGLDGPSSRKLNKWEKPGPFFNPIVAVMITSAARLVLSITETLLARHGETWASCDTDGIMVPVEHTEEIQTFFRDLNPYPFEAEMFKLEKENFGKDGRTLEPLFFYGISAKRYCLYNMVDGRPVVRKASGHGLGHLKNPFRDVQDKEWLNKVWTDILRRELGLLSQEEFDLTYSNLYAVSQFTVSTPLLQRRLNLLNEGRAYRDKVKPFNFCLVGTAHYINPETKQMVKPVVPYTKKVYEVSFSPFIDYVTGDRLQGEEYWMPFSDLLDRYMGHKEAKFDEDPEEHKMELKHIEVSSIALIGKESNNLEAAPHFGDSSQNLITYGQEYLVGGQDQEIRDFIMRFRLKDALHFGIAEKTLYRWRDLIREGKPITFRGKSKVKLMGAMKAERRRLEKITR